MGKDGGFEKEKKHEKNVGNKFSMFSACTAIEIVKDEHGRLTGQSLHFALKEKTRRYNTCIRT